MRRQSSYNKNHKSSAKKERIIMIASSVFVLAALTMTGVYVKSNTEKSKNDGYHIDFSALEKDAEELEAPELTPEMPIENAAPQVTEDDLDYMPLEQVGSGIVEIPGLTDRESLQDEVMPNEAEGGLAESADGQADVAEADVAEAEDLETTATQVTQKEAGFASGERLVWPVTGNVLIPYSMDKTVYFATLQQYKYNPALIVSAAEGDDISTVMSGTVTEIFYDEEIGNAVTIDIGKGYEVTYGQLENISVGKGDYVKKGEVIGSIAAPTKYYSVEGANAYFALTLDGAAVDPMGPLK